MRDDELTRVPKSIEPWRVMEFLRELGITPEDTYETTIGVRAVTVRLYATDETGHRYLGEDGNAAEHVVSVQYAGPWEKPSEPGSGDLRSTLLCPAVSRSPDTSFVVCELRFEHSGDHQGVDSQQNNRLWRNTGSVMGPGRAPGT